MFAPAQRLGESLAVGLSGLPIAVEQKPTIFLAD